MSSTPESQVCAKCDKKVEKDGLKAMGKLWHSQCFTCSVCKKCVDPRIVGRNFRELNGKPYCEKDYLSTLDKCALCQKAITDRKVTALEKNYHSNCFVCSVCKKSLEGQTFNADPQNNLYCIPDYQKKFALKCHSCGQPIVAEGSQTEAMRMEVFGNNYHINCFKCEECKAVLNDSNPCFPLGKHILCKKCNKKKTKD